MSFEVPDVAPLGPRDGSEAADLLARAFCDNPLNVAVIGGSPRRRLRANRVGSAALIEVAAKRGALWGVRDAGSLAGVLVATGPGGWPLPAPPLATRLRCLWGQGLGVARRWGAVSEALVARDSLDDCAYVGSLGVAPALQGRGFGAALLRGWLVGRVGERTRLETDRAENLSFYARAGFRVCDELELFGARIWCLERPAAAAELD